MKTLPIVVVVLLVGCSNDSERRVRSPDELRTEVQKAVNAEDYPAAERSLSTLIKLNSQDFDALVGRAAVRVLTGDSKGAKEDFNAAVKIDAEKGKKARFFISDRAIWRARYLDMQKRYDQALKIYDVLLTLYPKSGMAYHDRGGLKTEMKDYDGAIADLTKAIEFDEGNNSAGDSYILRARAKRAKGDETGAIQDEAKAKR